MRLRRLTFMFPMVIALGCSSSSNNADSSADRPDSADASTDRADVPTDSPADVPDGSSLDVASDGASAVDGADAADAPADGGPDGAGDSAADAAVDAADGATADVLPGTLPQRLAETILVSDSIGADGGVDASDAAGADGGDAGVADGVVVDPNLVNAWGLAFNPTGPLWVADNHSGLSTVYNGQGQVQPLVVTIPVAAGGTPPSAPTGLVFNPTANFMGDHFIFSSEDGTITGWQTGTAAALRVDNSTANAVYKGLALATQNGASRLYATDFHNGKVDVFDQTYAKIAASGFADPNLPAGFAPFGIQAMGTTIYVTYAQQDDMAMDDNPGPGKGYVDVFTFEGALQKRLVSQGALNSPWAIAAAPANFGGWANALLLGNFGDGHINAYNAVTGDLLGTALDPAGVPLAIDGLWSLVFGNGTAGAATNQLFFTAGPESETHGVLGRLDVVP